MELRTPLLPLLFSVLLAAGSPLSSEGKFPLTVSDDMGRAVTLSRPPLRIVSLTLPTDEMLLSLVDRKRILAVTSFSADPRLSNVASLVTAIPQERDLNVERLISLAPDLVLVANWSDAGRVSQLRDAGVPVYLMESARTVPQVAEKIRRLALLTGDTVRGERMVSEMQETIARVQEKLFALPAVRRLRILDYSVWGGAMGRGSTWDEIVRLAGLVNAVGDFAADEWGQVPLSREKILQIDPDILALPGWAYGDPRGADRFTAEVLKDPALSLLTAVRRGKVLRMPGSLQNTSSQYMAAAVEYLARAAYPGLFS